MLRKSESLVNLRSVWTARRRRGGFTLIELVVVLLVLIGLAGIVVPMLPNMITRTHSSANASTIQETAKALQLFENLNLSHPDGWDSLIDANGNTLRDDRFTVVQLSPPPVDGDGNSPGESGFDPDNIVNQDDLDLGARISSALNSVGITTSFTMGESLRGNGRPDGHANRQGDTARVNTFAPYPGGSAVPSGIQDLTGDGSVVILGPAANEFNRFGFLLPEDDPTTVAYVAFGIGERLSAVGRTISAAPVHFPDQGDLPPTLAYGRYAAIYRIPANGPAELATVAAIHTDHFDSLGNLLEDFWETTE
jgi:type II secretory pathway pseudopilin PulG